MTLKGGLADASASLPGWFSLESSSLPLASRISTHEAPLKRNFSVLPSAAVLAGSGFFASATTFGGSGFFASGFASTLAGTGIGATGSGCAGCGAGTDAAVAATGGGAGLRPAVAVGRMKSLQYIAAKAIATANTASVAAFT